MSFSVDDATKLINYIRQIISARLTDADLPVLEWADQRLDQKGGVFVTLSINGNLRGCIGFPEPILPLKEAITEAAQSAAFSDPRFRPLSIDEFKSVSVEISLLTQPQLIEVDDAQDYLSNIKIGEDGLIIRGRFGSGLLLPQVFTDYKCTSQEALEMTCSKAGLPTNAWKESGNKLYKFQAQIFKELEPAGKVLEEHLNQ